MRNTQSKSECHDQHAKRIQNGICPPPLKFNKDSHLIIKKSSSSSSSFPSHHRQPVIIYTHSPKIIHTSPKDFMALVQKLTGMSRSNNSNDDGHPHHPPPLHLHHQEISMADNQNNAALSDGESNKSDDNESSSVITSDDNCSGDGGGDGGNTGEGHVNSCFVLAPHIYEPPPPPPIDPYNYPIYNPNLNGFLGTHPPPFYNYTTDSLFFPPKMRASISSSSLLNYHHQGINDFHEF